MHIQGLRSKTTSGYWGLLGLVHLEKARYFQLSLPSEVGALVCVSCSHVQWKVGQ